MIVPIYKVEKYIRRCVDSILKQTDGDFELILVDDGSPDACPQICDGYKEQDPRVRVIHKPNGGLVSARKAGIFAAQGDYICYVDGDDWVQPGLLAYARDKIDHAGAPLDIICFGAEKVFASHTESMKNGLEEGYYDKARLEKEVYPYLFSDRRGGFRRSYLVPGYAWNKITRSALLREHYLRDERIRMFEDAAYVYECLLYASYVYFSSEPLYCYNKTNENAMSEEQRLYIRDNYVYVLDYLQSRIGGYSASISRQLNDFAALLIIWDVKKQYEKTRSVRKAARNIRDGLRSTGMLRFVNAQELPGLYSALFRLMKAGVYWPAVFLLSAKNRLKR